MRQFSHLLHIYSTLALFHYSWWCVCKCVCVSGCVRVYVCVSQVVAMARHTRTEKQHFARGPVLLDNAAVVFIVFQGIEMKEERTKRGRKKYTFTITDSVTK